MSELTPPTWAWVRGHGLMQMRDGICVAPVLHATYEPSSGVGIVVSETHARLIEAAPRLLAALDGMVAAAEHENWRMDTVLSAMVNAARAAIAAAKGNAP